MFSKYLILCFFIFVVLYLGSFNINTENFTNLKGSDPNLLLTDSYKFTGNKRVNNTNASDIWWYYPIFTEGSYAQITNNLRYRRNPDDGECSRAEFCGALYKSNKNPSNVIIPLPPVSDDDGIRVNYYRTNSDLFINEQPGKLLELPAF